MENNGKGSDSEDKGLGSSPIPKESDGGGRRIPHTGRSFMLPGEVPVSPPKFVSLEELMKAANGLTNMSLAHEIAVNKDFTLEKLELPENSFEKTVKETMHKVFWDLLRAELNEDPPNYTQALVLLHDVKHGLLELLLPQHTKIKEQISEVLDIDLITQQALAGTLDFQHYAKYVVSVMSKLCAPIRDDKIAELSKTTDVVDVFKGILETIDLMKIDMANFTISLIRPQIIASSVEYEKKKFADFLQTQTDGLSVTREWLGRHFSSTNDATETKRKVENILNAAYLELVEWNVNNTIPETLTLDAARIMELTNNFAKITTVGTILLLTYSHVGPNLSSINEFKNTLKTNILTIVDGMSAENISNLLEQVCVKLTDDVSKSFDKYCTNISQEQVVDVTNNLCKQVMDVSSNDNKVKQLLRQRIKEFLLTTITSCTAEPMKIPPGMSSLQQELTQVAGTYLRLVSHNRAVFGEYYEDIITSGLDNNTATTTPVQTS